VVVFGLFWKRHQGVAIATLLISWIANSLWSFTALPGALGLEGAPNAYVTLAAALAVLTVGNLLVEGRPGFFAEQGRPEPEPI
jgi:Na+/proline symporter